MLGIIVGIADIVVTIISILQSTRKDRDQKSNRPAKE